MPKPDFVQPITNSPHYPITGSTSSQIVQGTSQDTNKWLAGGMQKLHFNPDMEKGVPTLTSLPLSSHTSQQLSKVLNKQGCAEGWFHWSTNVISQLPAICAVTLPSLAVLPHASQYAPHHLHALLFSLVWASADVLHLTVDMYLCPVCTVSPST